MKVKDLRKLLKSLPANMEVMVNSGLVASPDETGLIQNYYYAAPVTKAKTKLVRKNKGYELVQSRPQKDSKAKLKLILE